MKSIIKIRTSNEGFLGRALAYLRTIPQCMGLITHTKAEAAETEARGSLAKKRLRAIEDIKDLRGAELFLREFCGLSRTASKAFLSRSKGLRQSDSDCFNESINSELYK